MGICGSCGNGDALVLWSRFCKPFRQGFGAMNGEDFTRTRLRVAVIIAVRHEGIFFLKNVRRSQLFVHDKSVDIALLGVSKRLGQGPHNSKTQLFP